MAHAACSSQRCRSLLSPSVVGRELYPASELRWYALLLAAIRLVQRQSIKYVAQAVIPTAIAVSLPPHRTSARHLPARHPLQRRPGRDLPCERCHPQTAVGFIIGAAVGDPAGWAKDPGLVRMTSKLTWYSRCRT